MTLTEIIAATRSKLDDNVTPYLWSDDDIILYLNHSINHLCEKTHIIKDSRTVDEALATGTITLTGASGQISSIKVNGVTVASAAVPFNTTLAQTAVDLAANINAYTPPTSPTPVPPDYTAIAAGAVVTISAKPGTGATPNGYVVSATAVTLGAAATNMAGGRSLCQLYLVPNQSVYIIDPRILAIFQARIPGQSYPLNKTSIEEINMLNSTWMVDEADYPTSFIPDIESGIITVHPTPQIYSTLNLSVSRFPLKQFVSTDGALQPELNFRHHYRLLDGILAEAYQKNDSETLNADKSMLFLNKFMNTIEEVSRMINREEFSNKSIILNKVLA